MALVLSVQPGPFSPVPSLRSVQRGPDDLNHLVRLVRLRDEVSGAGSNQLRLHVVIQVPAGQHDPDVRIDLLQPQKDGPAAELRESDIREHQRDVAPVLAIDPDRFETVARREYSIPGL